MVISQSRRIFFSIIASLVALFCVFAGPALAESGINRQINYQGRLLTSGGQSVTDGTYLLKLSLYDAASSGNRLWSAGGTTSTPTAVNVTVTNGLFSVQLGDVSAGQNPLDIDFYQNSIYLGVTVASDTEMLPRKRLTSVPYAFVAETLQGQYASSAVATTGGNLFTLQQTSTSAATADRTALFVRTSGTSNQFDYLIKAHSGSDVFTVSRQGNVTTTGNFASAGNVIVGDTSGDALIVNASLNSNIVPLTNNAFDLGSSSLSFANIYASGTQSTLRGLSFTSATGTNATTTSFAATVICLTGDTCRTSWPTSSGSSDSNWTFSSTNSMVYLATTTNDLVLGASASASAPFYFDVGQPTSSFQIGRVGNANLFVGTSTYNGSFNGPFSPNGDDAFIRGDLGVLGIGYFGTVTSSLVYGDIGLFGSASATRQFCIGNLASQCIDAPNSGQLRTTGTFRSDGPFLPLSGISSLGGDILPAATNLRSLGSASLSMLNIYASGTVVVGTNVTVGGQSVCLANGTNCPASSGTNYWGYNATNDTLYPASTTVDVLLGGATVSSTPFRFLTQTTSSRLFVGSFGSSTDIVIGNPTSTITNSLFQLNGGSLFALSNIGSASSIYTNAAVVISTGTILGDGFLNRLNGSINVSSSQDVTFTMSANLGVGTSTPSEKLTVVGNIQNTLVGDQVFTVVSSSTYRNLDNPTGILINENFGYVAQGGASTPLRIHIFDFENPAYPTSVSSLLLADTSGGGDVFTMALSGKYLYVPGQASNTVYIVDVSNARLPSLVSSISVTAPVEALTQGRFLFIRTTNSIRVYDLSDPTNPTLVRSVSGTLTGGKTTIYKNILYAANSSNSVLVYDITNPALPVSLGSVGLGSPIRPIYVQDGFIYIGATNRLAIWNVMNPKSTFQASQSSITGTPSSLTVSGRYAFLTLSGGIGVYDVASTTSPILLQTITGFGQGASSTAVVAGQYLVATNVPGDSIIVIKIPGVETSSLTAHMMQAGSLSVRTDASIANQLIVGGGLQIGNGGFSSDGSFSVNATNTTSTIRYTLSISGTTTMAGDSVTLGNGFVTTGTFGIGTSTSPERLTVVGNVKNTLVDDQPLNIVASTTFPTLENPTGLMIDGKNMYLAQKGGNTAFIFRVMDISNPAYPTSVGSLQLSQTAGNNNYFSMAQSGKYVYVPGQASNTVYIVDVSYPANPTLAGSFSSTAPLQVLSQGHFLYVRRSAVIEIYDIANPISPTLIRSFSAGSTGPMVISKNFLYSARTTGNVIEIYDIRDPYFVSNVATISAGGNVHAMAVQDGFLYAGMAGEVRVFNVKNPLITAQVEQDSSLAGNPFSAAVSGRYFIVSYTGGYQLYDVASSTSIIPLQTVTGFGTAASSTVINGKYLYSTYSAGETITVTDLSGIETTGLLAHSADIGSLSVQMDANIANQLIVGGSLQIGSGGFISDGSFAVNATNTTSTFAGTVTVQGRLLCLADGTNCPASGSASDDWFYDATADTIRPSTTTSDVLIGGAGAANAPFRFLTQTTSSRLFVGANGSSTDIVVGGTTSTITNSAFQLNGGSIFAAGSIGAASNVFVNQSLYVSGTILFTNASGSSLDLNEISQPTLVGQLDFASGTAAVAVSGKYAFTAQGAQGLNVIDVHDPINPTSVRMFDTAGSANDVKIAGSYAYVADGSNGLSIIDVSNPFSPVLVGNMNTTGTTMSVYVSGRYAYITDTGSFQVIDISDITAPTTVGSFFASGISGGVIVSTNYAYVGDCNQGGVRVIDISNPRAPVQVSFGVSGGCGTRGFDISGRYLQFIDNNQSELRVFDISNPASMSLLTSIGLNSSAESLIIAGRYAYAAGGAYLQAIDVSSSTFPFVKAEFTSSTVSYTSMGISGKYAYLGGSNGEFHVIDLRGADINVAQIGALQSNDINVLKDIEVGNNAYIRNGLSIGFGGISSNGALSIHATNTTSTISGPLTVQGQLVCLANGTNCPTGAIVDDWTYDASTDVIRPTTSSVDVLFGAAGAANAPFRFLTQTTSSRLFVGANGSSTDIVVGGTTSTITNSVFQLNGGNIFAAGSIAASSSIFTNGSLYVSGTIQFAYASGSALDLNIKNAFSEATTTISGGANDIAVSGRYAYIAGGTTSTGLTIVDIADPLYPQSVTTVNAGVIGRGVAVAGKNVYLAASLGLAILDVSNPSAPSSVASFATGAEGANDVIVSGKYAYLSVARGEAFVLDISNPLAPTSVARITLQVGTAGKMFLHNTYLYIANGANGTEVYDVADPRKPAYIATISSAGDVPYAPYVSGRYAYTAEGGEGLQITDVSNPNSPVVKSLIGAGTGLSYDVTVAGKYAYVSTDGGVAVMDVSSSTAPTAVTLSGGYGRANAVAVAGKYAYVAHTTGITVVDMQGAEISAANIGSVWTNTLTVLDSVDIGNSVNIRNSLSVGAGGILSDGPIVASELTIAAVRSVSLKSSVSIPNGDTLFGIAVSGRYAYISTNSTSLRILDITNPASPSSVGTLANASSGRAVAVSGKYAYLTENNGLNPLFRVVDISNPFAPTTTGVIGGLSVNVGQVVVHGTYVYVGDSSNGVRVIDVSNPRNPRIAATAKTTASTQNEMYVQAPYLYIAEGGTDLEIIDISNPLSPTSVGVLAESSSSTQSVVVGGRYAYVGFGNEGVKVIDVKDPTAPVVVSTYNTGGNAAGLKLIGSYLLVADTNGIVALDVSNPADPRFVSQYYGNFSTVKKLVVSGKYAYAGDTSNASAAFNILDLQGADIAAANIGTLQAGSIQVLDSLDVANLANIRNALTVGPGGILSEGLISARGVNVDSFEYVTSVGRLTPGGGIDYDTIDVQGRFAYLTDSSNNRTYVIDVSNPAAPTSVASATISANGESLAVAGRYAYVANGTGASAFEVVDISTPNSPRVVGTMASASSVQSLHVEGNYAYAAAAGQGVRVIDISDPIAPTTVGMVGLGSNVNALDVYVQGRYAYVIGGTGSMYVVDVNTSSRPVIVGSLGISSARYVRTSGRYAYVAGSDNTMSVIDVQNPAAPTQVATTTLNGSSPFIAISGRYAFAALGSQGLQILDITTPTAPTSVRYLPSLMDGNFCSEIQIVGRYLYGACTSGFYVIDLGGVDVTTLRAGSLESSDISVLDRLSVANRIEVGGGITVGMNGVHTDGELSGRTLRAIDNEGTATGSAAIFFKSVTGTAGTAYQFTGLTSFTTGTGGSLDALPDLNRFTFGTAVQSAAAFVANGFSNTLGNNAVGLLAVDMTSSTTGGAIFAARACGDAVNGNIMKLSTDTDTSRFTFRCNGQLFTDNGASGNPADYAEFFPTNDTSLTAGEVVALSDTAVTTVRRAMLGDRERVLGVISANPLILGNAGPDGANENNPYFKKVGLLGQLITRVSDSNGQIRAGDKVTVGDDGYAVKASGVGMVLGYAMEHLTTATGTIRVYVNPTWSGDGIFEASASTTNVLPQGIATASSTLFDSYGLTFEGSAWSASSNTAFVSSFTLVNNVISASSSLFQINGTNGTSLLTISDVGDVSVTGDLTVGRRLFLGSKNTGEGSTSTYIFVDDTQAPSSTYIATNADGWSTSSTYDYAERFPSAETLAAGDVVTTDPTDINHVKRSSTANDIVLGIVSTKPGFITGAYASGTYPIALAGRVPTRVSTVNGPIVAGDQLAPSNEPGVAVKAISSGPIIGIALEGYDAPTEGKISVFVQPGWKGGEIVSDAQSGPSTIVYQTQTFDPGVSPRAGLARISAGSVSVDVSFASVQAYPLITVSPYGLPTGNWGLINVNDHGFTITLTHPETFDLVFAWKAEPSVSGAVMSFSDGTSGQYDALTGQVVGSPTSSTEPVVPAAPTDTTTSSTDVAGDLGSTTGTALFPDEQVSVSTGTQPGG